MSGGRHGEGRRRPPSELQGGGKKSGGGPSRTSRSGLLPSPVVWGNDAPQPSFLALLHNGGANLLLDGYDSGGGGGGGGGGRGRGGGAAARAALANGERSSDSEDSGATSGATSGKEASPGCEESSGSEQSSAPPHDDTRHDDDQSSPAPARSRAALPRSRTTPMLNGGRHAALDDALRPLTLYGPETGGGGLGRVRAAHEANMSKLAYLEALFTRAKLEEARLEGSREELRSRQPRPAAPRSLHSPETGYKTLPASCSDHALRGLAGGISTPALPDGHTLLRTIETRLQLARPREGGGAARGTLYQCGNSSSAGSLTHLASSGSPATSGASTPSRFLSPSRKEAPVSLASATSAGGGAPKRPDGLPARPAGHGSQHSLPHNYRSRSAYSSPAVSPQRGPDPGGFLTSPSGTAQRRFSSLELRGARGPSAPRQLPLRHTAHGFPSSGVALSPPSPAQGAQAFHRKMQLFFDIMETQSRFSQDLQSEIESHKDVLASLNATGQRLLGTLDNQEEAVMLQRRLEEMNLRWNTLKHRSIAIRNRLEGNSENWTTLLLSLRELIEWVIRKDTELTTLGPLVGDLGALSKYHEDLAAFRRVIEDKQPVIESNLKSGRQLIASEPPLSDTSDSEAGRELDADSRYRGDETARDLTRAVRREVAKLSEKWAALRERVAAISSHTDLALKKLGVLQKTVEDVSGRVEEAERAVESWGGVPSDPNLADQHSHNVKKFREGLVELQRGVDDVNDQAARFSAHSVPLTPANSAKLHDLNTRWKNLETAVNDRWRQVAGRSREVTPLTPAQLASSVGPPWERATTSNDVPYFINHDQENTHWDHPTMMDILDSLTEFNHIKFSAYRTATKLRVLQKRLALDKAKMQTATDIFDEHGLRGQNDRLIDIGDMVVVLSALYGTIAADHPDVDTTLAMDLCLNWLLNVYDSQRTGQMRVLSFKIGLVCLCTGHLEEKYRYMFRLIADPNRLVDQRKLGLLLHDCVQVPRQLGEVAAFGGSNIEPSVRSCFTKAGKDRETIEAVHFLAWVQQEPQSLVWLAVLHRVAASENIQHQVKCNICKAYPILGLRYRCLKCLSFDMCQDCFFDGRSGKNHKITHPMHEYCTATTAGEDVKDFTKALKNKFKSKRSLQKHTKKGYLPVQTVLEGDPLESPSPSPQHNVTSQDMHSRLEMYASRLAEVELRTTHSHANSTPDSEDEHGLIAQYCQSLSSSDAPLPVPRSPLQIMAAVDADQKDELEQMIRALEDENTVLQAEYNRLKSQQPVGSPEDSLGPQRSEAEMLAEAKLLRQHKGRLEARMGILEEHNRQLEAQLQRLRQLLGETGLGSPSKSNTLQTKSVTASQLAMDSPAKINGHSAQGDLGKAVGNLVATMNQERERDSHEEEEEEEEPSPKEEERKIM